MADFINCILINSNEYGILDGKILRIYKKDIQESSCQTVGAHILTDLEEEEECECPICYIDISDKIGKKNLCFQCDTCKKNVCFACISKWHKNDCPMCRAPIMKCLPAIPQ